MYINCIYIIQTVYEFIVEAVPQKHLIMALKMYILKSIY